MKERALRFGVYGAIGIAAGLVAALLDYVTIEIVLETVVNLPIGLKLLAPGAGLVLTAGILRWPGLRSPVGTSEEFIRAYHDRNDRLRLRYLPARLAAGLTTVGFGGAMGLEGPAIYAGSTIGASMQTRMRGLFADKDKRMLMVAGAAAGVAAIFKTPATGVLFALEVPYQGDVARRALLPALIASATAYITFVTATQNIDPIFSISGLVEGEDFESVLAAREIIAALLIGLLAGFGAALMARLVKEAKKIERHRPWWQRVLAASTTLGILIVITEVFYDGEPLTMGPAGAGELFRWVAGADVTLVLLLGLFAFRMLATVTTMAGGGVGGVFIPLAVQGILLGRIVSLAIEPLNFVDQTNARILLPAVGLAAFLGAGYRTPLASVMFVAESTGNSRFVVPALIASAMAQVVMGGRSVSSFQKVARVGHLEERFEMSTSSALNAKVDTVASTLPLSEFVWNHALASTQHATAVVDDGKLVGMCSIHEAAETDRERWSEMTVADIMIKEPATARLAWSLREASRVMEKNHVDLLPVVDVDNRFLGVVTQEEIVRLDVMVGDVPPQLS